MKKLLFIFLLLGSLVSSAQITPPSGFTAINQRYHWLAGRFQDSLYIGTGDFIGAPLGTRLSSILTTNSSSGHKLNAMFRANQTAATSGSIQGVESYIKTSNATGTVTLAIGHVGNGEHSGAGTVTWMRSVQGGGILSGAGTVTNWAGLYSQPGAITGTGTITNLYGAYLADPTQGEGTITNRWGLYSADDSATNYFAGFVRLAKAPATIDTTTYKPVVRNTTTGDLYTGSWQGAGGGSVPSLEEVLDVNFTVGGNNIDMEDMSIHWTVTPGVVGDLVPSITASRDWILPDQSGTIALVSDITGITANNGITENVSNNFQLGGSLTATTTIAAGSSYVLNITGSTGYSTGTEGIFRVVTTSASGQGIYVHSTSSSEAGIQVIGGTYGLRASGTFGISTDGTAVGLFASSTAGTAVSASSTSGTALYGSSTSGIAMGLNINPSSTNTVVQGVTLSRATSGTAAAGIGVSEDVYIENSTNGSNISNQLIYKLTDATAGAEVSQFEVWGKNSGTLASKFIVKGTGVINIPTALGNYADNAAALAGGLVAGDIYRNGDVLMIVH